MAAILVASAAAAGARTWRAPYKGENEWGSITGTTYGCRALLSFLNSPFFNLTTGKGYVSAQSSAKSCGGAYSLAAASGAVSLESALFTTTAGLHHLKFSWTTSYAFTIGAVRGNSTQTAYASVEAYAYGWLFDETNHSTLYTTAHNFQFNSTYSGTVSGSFAGLHLWSWVNATLAAGHNYSWDGEFIVSAYSYVTPGKSTAAASINAGTGGRSATLLSVVMS